MCTHTRTRARGVQGGPSAPPPAATPPVGKVDLALQLTAYIHCDWTLRNVSPTGGVVAGGGAEGSPLHPPRVCVHLWYFLIVLNCIKFYINLNCLPFFYLPLIYLFLRFSSTCQEHNSWYGSDNEQT